MEVGHVITRPWTRSRYSVYVHTFVFMIGTGKKARSTPSAFTDFDESGRPIATRLSVLDGPPVKLYAYTFVSLFFLYLFCTLFFCWFFKYFFSHSRHVDQGESLDIRFATIYVTYVHTVVGYNVFLFESPGYDQPSTLPSSVGEFLYFMYKCIWISGSGYRGTRGDLWICFWVSGDWAGRFFLVNLYTVFLWKSESGWYGLGFFNNEKMRFRDFLILQVSVVNYPGHIDTQ